MQTTQDLIEAASLHSALADARLLVFDTTVNVTPKPGGGYDVRSGREAYEREHIPGAGFLDLLTDFSAPDAPLAFTLPSPERFASAASAAGVGANSRVVLYNSGPTWWSTRMWFMFRDFGFDAVSVLDGGFDRWRALGLPIASGTTTFPAATFPIRPRRGFFVGKNEVKAALESQSCTLVNALTADIHSGRVSSQPRPGRIPGSRHLFALDLLDATTRQFLRPDALRAHFESAEVLGDKPVIAYCGGGISATMNAFALHLVGRDDAQIYDGSLSEWSRDPQLPLEVDPPNDQTIKT
jgi:thiosulfate/3-mercaptopyruvate sulfurtransferase